VDGIKNVGRTSLGHGGHKSLADLGMSYELIRKMRVVPIAFKRLHCHGVPRRDPHTFPRHNRYAD
jgi:hypothetical protein